MSTASWLPFLPSKAVKVCSSVAFCSAVSVRVWSITCPVNGGTGTYAAVNPDQNNAPASNSALPITRAVRTLITWPQPKQRLRSWPVRYQDRRWAAWRFPFSFSTAKLGLSL